MAKEIFWVTLVTRRKVEIIVNTDELKYTVESGDTEREIWHKRNVAVVELYNSKHQVQEALFAKFARRINNRAKV